MKNSKTMRSFLRRLCLLLLAVLFLFGAANVGPRAEAAEKSLSVACPPRTATGTGRCFWWIGGSGSAF